MTEMFKNKQDRQALFSISLVVCLLSILFTSAFIQASPAETTVTEESLLLTDGSNPMLGNLNMSQNQIVSGVFHKGSTPPASPVEGQYFYDTDDHILYVYNTTAWVDCFAEGGVTDHGTLTGLTDDDHTQYLLADGSRVMAGDLNMSQNEILFAILHASGSAPSNPSEGQVYYDTGDHLLYVYNSTDWVSPEGSQGPAGEVAGLSSYFLLYKNGANYEAMLYDGTILYTDASGMVVLQNAVDYAETNQPYGATIFIRPPFTASGTLTVGDDNTHTIFSLSIIADLKRHSDSTGVNGIAIEKLVVTTDASYGTYGLYFSGILFYMIEFNPDTKGVAFCTFERCGVRSNHGVTSEGIVFKNTNGGEYNNIQFFDCRFIDVGQSVQHGFISFDGGDQGNGQVYFHNCVYIASTGTLASVWTLVAVEDGGWCSPEVVFMDLNAYIPDHATNIFELVHIYNQTSTNGGLDAIRFNGLWLECHVNSTLFEIESSTEALHLRGMLQDLWLAIQEKECVFVNNANSNWFETRHWGVSIANCMIVGSVTGADFKLGTLGIDDEFRVWISNIYDSTADYLSDFPIGVITNPFDTTHNLVEPQGDSATPSEDIDYEVTGCVMTIAVSGGTGVSITLKDKDGTTIASGLESGVWTLAIGQKIRFSWTGAPTIVVAGSS